LFPETVFNAPASHLAAILGVTGAVYTLVGDGAVGLLAIKMAEDVMVNAAFDYCLVVGAEEVDWLLCDAYHRWRLLRFEPPVEPFHQRARGMILSEGAGAVLLAREGSPMIKRVDGAGHYRKRAEAPEILKRILRGLDETGIDFVVSSANGTFLDEAERKALAQVMPDAVVYTAKAALGESVGAAGLWQVIIAALALRRGELPPLLHAEPTRQLQISTVRLSLSNANDAIVLSCGVNQQVAGLRLSNR
jgi:3-oxoacyl-(acyl-carrier-protein) synthase